MHSLESLKRLLFLMPLYAAPDGPGATMPAFIVKKKVTLPLLSLKKDDIVMVRFDTVAKLGKELKGDKKPDGTAKKEPAHLAQVTDLTTGEEMQMIVPAVLRSTLEEEYPAPSADKPHTYLGKSFQITHLGKKTGGKNEGGYNLYKIVEIELTGAKQPTPPAPSLKK